MFIRSRINRTTIIGALLALILTACADPQAISTPEIVVPTPEITPTVLVPTSTIVEPTETPSPRPVSVEAVSVEFGEGTTVAVDVIVSGTWPDVCAQLEHTEQRVLESRIEIDLLATPPDPDCASDQAGDNFRIAIPLNVGELPVGAYTVVVNGVENSFEWTGKAPEEVVGTDMLLAYIGQDGNLWTLDRGSGEERQVTMDAVPGTFDGDVVSVEYYFPSLSSDGKFLAVRRDTGAPVDWGIQYQIDLWVYDLESGEAHLVLEDERAPAGFDWKPGTHLLAYGLGTAPGYFVTRGVKPDEELVTGIFAVDMDSGENYELVEPERGYTIILPTWSPDGRFLSFDEVFYMEGRGPFGYYDFEAGEYIAWEEAIGNYSFSPDSSQIAYDRLTYTASGDERIIVRDRLGGEEGIISPESIQGYTFYPVFSPQGDRMAYLVGEGELGARTNRLFVQDLPDGEPRELGTFESAWDLQWSQDGGGIVLRIGQYENYQVIEVDVQDGTIDVLTQGTQPTIATP